MRIYVQIFLAKGHIQNPKTFNIRKPLSTRWHPFCTDICKEGVCMCVGVLSGFWCDPDPGGRFLSFAYLPLGGKNINFSKLLA